MQTSNLKELTWKGKIIAVVSSVPSAILVRHQTARSLGITAPSVLLFPCVSVCRAVSLYCANIYPSKVHTSGQKELELCIYRSFENHTSNLRESWD